MDDWRVGCVTWEGRIVSAVRPSSLVRGTTDSELERTSLDVLGRTRATLTHAASLPWPKGLGNLVNVCRDRDRLLQLLILNEEFLVNAGHQLALITP